MNSDFYPCRISAISKLGRFAAQYVYPCIGIILAGIPLVICAEWYINNDYTVVQTVVLLVTVIIAILLSLFLFIMSIKCYRMEVRYISVDSHGFVIREKNDKRYTWEMVEGIRVIAYAATASKDIYQSQICIFLEPVTDNALRKLRDSYLYGVFNRDKYILLDNEPCLFNKLDTCSDIPITDSISKQLKL